MLRNFEGVISSYPEPKNYIPNQADEFFHKVFPEESSETGVSSLLTDKSTSLIPEGLKRIERRETYVTDPNHEFLKNRREKRDELKEKKFLAQLKKEKHQVTKNENV